MVERAFALALGALLLCAADYPDPPPVLAPYIEDGRLQPGDYAWIEGSFGDAPPDKKAEFDAIRSWADNCMAQAKERVRADLAAAGFRAASLDGVAIGPLVCRQATIYPRHPELTSYARLRQEMALARPVAESFLMAVNLASELGNQGGGDVSPGRWRHAPSSTRCSPARSDGARARHRPPHRVCRQWLERSCKRGSTRPTSHKPSGNPPG